MAKEKNKLVMSRFFEFINTASEKLAFGTHFPGSSISMFRKHAEPMRGPGGYLEKSSE